MFKVKASKATILKDALIQEFATFKEAANFGRAFHDTCKVMMKSGHLKSYTCIYVMDNDDTVLEQYGSK